MPLQPKLLQVYDTSTSSGSTVSSDSTGELSLQIHYTFPHWLHTSAGAPSHLVLIITSSPSKNDSTAAPNDSSLQLSLVWVNKTATRIPEALWLRFNLDSNVAVDADSWRLHKMGSAIDPLEVRQQGPLCSQCWVRVLQQTDCACKTPS
jgi:hypothetical protein